MRMQTEKEAQHWWHETLRLNELLKSHNYLLATNFSLRKSGWNQ